MTEHYGKGTVAERGVVIGNNDPVKTPHERSHEALVGKTDHQLRLISGEATHQHFKGGLYRHLGPARDADTGEPIVGKDGKPRVAYLHLYPHARELWVRDHSEFFGAVPTTNLDNYGNYIEVPRFRRLA
jgi:hypothetical protein